MDENNLRQLRRVEVEGLFGVYDHKIDLNVDDRITLLHGANGVGKTHTLAMINALLRRDTGYFRRVPCKRFRLTFSDSVLELSISTKDREKQRGQLRLREGGKDKKEPINLGTEADDIARRVGYLERHKAMGDTWIDTRDGELLSEDQVLLRFGRRRPGSAQRRLDEPPWFRPFLEHASAYFIEAQRLVRTRPSRRNWRHPSISDQAVPTVSLRRRDFRERFRETMADYGRKAQTLDQTFPQRLLDDKTERFNDEELEQRITALEKETAQLEELGILGEATGQPNYPLNVQLKGLDDTRALVLTLYVQDTEQKLDALGDFPSRVRSLLSNLNSKFRNKRLRVDRDKGFVAETDKGKDLPLSSLSSGEQHELLLHYDLLFRVPANTIVLIDEPELSLHVSWQKRFLPDLLEIAKLSAFDAIVATHSPYIIGDRDDLMVGLGEHA